MTKIYGYKLPPGYWVHKEYAEETDENVVNPEDDICEACHLYYDEDGNGYIGFDLVLGLPKEEMNRLLNTSKRKGIYKVLD